MSMKYMTVLEASRKWGVSDRRVRFLCSQGRIRGIIQQGRRYLIPDGTEKPLDERLKKSSSSRSMHYNDFTRLDLLKTLITEEPEMSEQDHLVMDEKFVAQFIYECNALEGNTLQLEDVQKILDNQVVEGHSLTEHLDVLGMKDAWDYARECIEEKKPLSQNIIRNLHSLVMIQDPGEKGKYRRVKVRIKGTDSAPVYLDLMEPRINDLLNINTQRKKVMHPIERITRFHLEFEGIHPFQDGNGRVGRILLNLELMQSGYPPINIAHTSKKQYEKAIQHYYQDHQAEDMIKLISENLEESLEAALKSVRKKKRARKTDDCKSNEQ